MNIKERLELADIISKQIFIESLREKTLDTEENYTEEQYLVDVENIKKISFSEMLYKYEIEELLFFRETYLKIKTTRELIIDGLLAFYIKNISNVFNFYLPDELIITSESVADEVINILIPLNNIQRVEKLIHLFTQTKEQIYSIRESYQEIKHKTEIEETFFILLYYQHYTLSYLIERIYLVFGLDLVQLCEEKNCLFVFSIPNIRFWRMKMYKLKNGEFIAKKEKTEEKKNNIKIGTELSVQVLALETLLSCLNIDLSTTSKTDIASFIQFITGRQPGTKSADTTIYKSIGKTPLSNKEIEAYNKRCDIVAEHFKNIGLIDLANKVIRGKE